MHYGNSNAALAPAQRTERTLPSILCGMHCKAFLAAAGIEETLKMLMGTALKTSDLHTSVVIPSYELETSSPFTFWHKHGQTLGQSKTGFIAMQRSEDLIVAGTETDGMQKQLSKATGSKDVVRLSGGVQLVKGRDFKLWEVARASSAAPSYFPCESSAVTITSPHLD